MFKLVVMVSMAGCAFYLGLLLAIPVIVYLEITFWMAGEYDNRQGKSDG